MNLDERMKELEKEIKRLDAKIKTRRRLQRNIRLRENAVKLLAELTKVKALPPIEEHLAEIQKALSSTNTARAELERVRSAARCIICGCSDHHAQTCSFF